MTSNSDGRPAGTDLTTTPGSVSHNAPLPIPMPRAALKDTGFGSDASFAENELRGKVVDRMKLMALRHCMHLDERRGTRLAVGPHALAFLFATGSGGQPGDRDVVAGTRLLFDYDDVIDTYNLSAVLDTLILVAHEYRPGTFDPREHMCNRVEPMGRDAELIGVGVTTVYPAPDGAARASTLGMDQPYRAVVRMIDGTDLWLTSPGGFFAAVQVWATQTLNVRGVRTRDWNWWSGLRAPAAEPELPSLLGQLSALLDLAAGYSPVRGPEQPVQSEHRVDLKPPPQRVQLRGRHVRG
jgi:hypothetical protein